MSNVNKEILKQITMNIKYIGGDYPPFDEKESMKMHHYKLQLKYQGRSYTLNFWSCATSIPLETANPKLEGVLECLFSDASCIRNGYENFCDDLGYERNAKSKKIFRNCERVKERLEKLLQKDYQKIECVIFNWEYEE